MICNMKNGYCIKSYDKYFFFVSFIFWLMPFLLRMFLIEFPTLPKTSESQTGIIVSQITEALDKEEYFKAFLEISSNNLHGCMINILGGFLLGLVTLLNLSINGLAASDVFTTVYNSGFGLNNILKSTLPHSFELIGFWLSGAMGLAIAWEMIGFMRGKKSFSAKFYNPMALYLCVVFVITLGAAFVEVYISIKGLK